MENSASMFRLVVSIHKKGEKLQKNNIIIRPNYANLAIKTTTFGILRSVD